MGCTSTISRPTEIGLRLIGVWPDSPYIPIHRCFWVSTLGIVLTFQYKYIVVHFGRDNLARVMDCVSATMSYTLMLFKLSIFWLNRRVFRDILTTMAEDWTDCAGKSDVNAMTNTVNFSYRCSKIIIGLYAMAVVFSNVGVLTNFGDCDNGGETSEIAQPREHFLKMELPFDSDSSPNYEILMVIQFFHQISASSVLGVLNALIIAIILHVSSQIDIVCEAISKISSSRMDHDTCVSIVKAIIVKHQRIISLANNIEKLLTYIALMQFLLNTLVSCSLGYQIVETLGKGGCSATLVKSISYYIAITLEVFILCFVGEHLGAKSKLIGTAAYNSTWYDMKPAQSKLLMLLMLRAQKPLSITIGTFMDLSLERFTAFVKGSASYVSVLHAMS